MILDTNLNCEEYLHIQCTNLRTWEYYFKQYNTAFCYLLGIVREHKYKTNIRFMPFLFLLRHSIELLLKYTCDKEGLCVKQTHNLEELKNALKIKDDFSIRFKELACNSDGDCFRYLTDNNNIPFFTEEILDGYSACSYYITFFNRYKPESCNTTIKELEDNKFVHNEVYFHLKDCLYLGVLATQYDFTISAFLIGLKDKTLSAQDIYLPLLFLIRHTLELKLKALQLELQMPVKKVHNLRELYKNVKLKIDTYIKKLDDDELKKQSQEYQRLTDEFQNIINKLDNNSLIFRFPIDKKGNKVGFTPQKDDLIKVYILYKKTDSFLTFVIPVLRSALSNSLLL